MFCIKCGNSVEEDMLFCDRCGAPLKEGVQSPYETVKADSPTAAGKSGMPAAHPAAKKKKISGVIGICVGALVVILLSVFIYANTGGRPEIRFVKNSSPYLYPDQTYGEAFDDFFEDPSWDYFQSDDGRDVVEFTGGCSYRGENADIYIQFVARKSENYCTVCYASVNGNGMSDDEILNMIGSVFEQN